MGMRLTRVCLLVVAGALLGLPSVAAAQSGPPPDSSFQKVTLNPHPGEPMGLAVRAQETLRTLVAGMTRLTWASR